MCVHRGCCRWRSGSLRVCRGSAATQEQMFALLVGPLGYDKFAYMMPGHHLDGFEKVRGAAASA